LLVSDSAEILTYMRNQPFSERDVRGKVAGHRAYLIAAHRGRLAGGLGAVLLQSVCDDAAHDEGSASLLEYRKPIVFFDASERNFALSFDR
jgi:L-amino acid N-acyltransferase YncA